MIHFESSYLTGQVIKAIRTTPLIFSWKYIIAHLFDKVNIKNYIKMIVNSLRKIVKICKKYNENMLKKNNTFSIIQLVN